MLTCGREVNYKFKFIDIRVSWIFAVRNLGLNPYRCYATLGYFTLNRNASWRVSVNLPSFQKITIFFFDMLSFLLTLGTGIETRKMVCFSYPFTICLHFN